MEQGGRVRISGEGQTQYAYSGSDGEEDIKLVVLTYASKQRLIRTPKCQQKGCNTKDKSTTLNPTMEQ